MMVDPVPFVNSNAFASIALTDQYLREVYLGKGRVSEGKNIVFLQCVDSLRVPCITTQRCVRHAVFLTDTPQLVKLTLHTRYPHFSAAHQHQTMGYSMRTHQWR